METEKRKTQVEDEAKKAEAIPETTRQQIERFKRELRERDELIRAAQLDLEKRKIEAKDKEKEINAALPGKLTQAFLGDKEAVKEAKVLKMKLRNEQALLSDYKLIEEGLKGESLKQGPKRNRVTTLTTKVRVLDNRWEEFKRSPSDRTAFNREMLLKAAEEIGEREQIEKELEKLDSK